MKGRGVVGMRREAVEKDEGTRGGLIVHLEVRCEACVFLSVFCCDGC